MPPNLNPLHLLNVSTEGTFKPSGNYTTKPEDVDVIFDHLSRNQVSHLVLYFHGGLVSEDEGVVAATTLTPLLAGQDGAHPVFFVWESSWQDGVREMIEGITAKDLFKAVVDAVVNFVSGKLQSPPASRGAGAIPLLSGDELEEEKAKEIKDVSCVKESQRERLEPVTDEEARQFEMFLRDDMTFQQEANRLAAGFENGSTNLGETMLSEEVLADVARSVEEARDGRGIISTAVLAGMALKVFASVVKRLIDRTDHGVYCTAVEETLRLFYVDKVGGQIWNGMKGKIRHAFDLNEGLSGNALHAGTYFIERLRDYIAGAETPLKVSLVGHSAGAIYVCRFLERAYATLGNSFHFGHLVMLAPAVDFDLFRTTVVDRAGQFESLRIFTMGDEFEASDKMLPVFYPRSLLYFVSGLLEGGEEKPLVGMERFYTGQPPYNSDDMRRVINFLKQDGADRIVFAVTKPDASLGVRCGARKHGGFVLDAQVQESLAHILRA